MTIEIAIGLLAGLFVIAIGAALGLLRQHGRQARQARERALSKEKQSDETFGKRRVSSTAERVGQAMSSGKTSRGLRQRLAMAGFHSESAASTFLGYKLFLLILGALAVGVLVLPLELTLPLKLATAAAAGGCLFMVPNLVVEWRRRKRREEVRRHLPDAIDLLDICVSSGMGLDTAWNAVADEMRRVNTTLADEMDLANLEMSLGAGRAIAMRHMAERTGAEEISSLVALLLQSERFGASVVDALRTFAENLRETRSARAEEAAEKMAVKMLFPMVMFVFPPLLIVLVGPAMVELIATIGGS